MEIRGLSVCRLVVTPRPWCFAEQHRAAIEQHWAAARAGNPKLFNGDVFIVDQWAIADGKLVGQVLPIDFAGYLFWRNAGGDRGHYNEAFASALIFSADGGIFLAQSVGGTLNAGRYGPPGGLIDASDVASDGQIDFATAAARELLEETGLIAGEMERQDGYLLARFGDFLAIVSVFRSALSGRDLIDRVATHLASVSEPELEAPRMIYRPGDLDGLPLTPYARLLVTHGLGM